MTSTLSTLLVCATNVPTWKRVCFDSVRWSLGLKTTSFPERLQSHPLIQKLFGDNYESLSYVVDWRDAFLQHPQLAVTVVNLNYFPPLWRELKNISRYDLIVILPSAAGDCMDVLHALRGRLAERRGRLAIVIGNEYGRMTEKIQFANDVHADFVASQLPVRAAEWLYKGQMTASVLTLPAALNPNVYFPKDGPRPIDVGFHGARYDFSIGDQDREHLLHAVQEKARSRGWRCEINRTQLTRVQWAFFLQSCKSTLGSESGTAYLERNGELEKTVKTFLKSHPDASFDQVFTRFFKSYPNPVSGKAISSRHFEAIGTQTCQILLEGNYNGILEEGRHYIGIKRDFSNVDDALAQYSDESIRRRIVQCAYEHVRSKHTYAARIGHLIEHIQAAPSQRTFRLFDCQAAVCTALAS